MPHFQNQLSRNDAAYAWAGAERARNLDEMTRALTDYTAKHAAS